MKTPSQTDRLFSNNNYQVPSMPLDDNLLTLLFSSCFDLHSFPRTAQTLSLVCREWKQIIDSPLLWKCIFERSGFSLPRNPQINLAQAFCDQMQFHLVKKMRACTTPLLQEINVPIQFNNYDDIQFIEDSHVFVYKDHVISICNLDHPEKLIKIILPSPISVISACTEDTMIYCCLENGEIHVCSSIDKPVSSLLIKNSFSEDQDTIDTLLANNKWLIGCTGNVIKQWDMEKGTLVATHSRKNSIMHVQIDLNKLYWTEESSAGELYLYSLDLCKGTITTLSDNIESTAANIKICGNKCFYFAKALYDSEDASSDWDAHSEEDQYSPYKLICLDMRTQDSEELYTINMSGSDLEPHLSVFNDLAIIAHDDRLEDNQPSSPILKCIDLQQGKCLHSLLFQEGNDFIEEFFISVFNNKILYVKEDKIVKMSFPKTNKL